LLAAGLGLRVYGELVPLLLFADDIVLLASSPTMMQKMLDVVSAYARKWRFEVNHSKCGLLVFGSALAKRYAELFPWLLCGTEVPVVQYYKYLGLEFSRSTLCGKWNIFLKRMLEKTKKSLNYMLWQSSGGRALTRVRLWQAKCRPILEYAAELWHGEIADEWVIKLERIQSTLCMAALKLAGSPSSVALRAELGLLPLACRRDLAKLRVWFKWCSTSDDMLLKKIFVERHAEVVAGAAPLSNLNSMKVVLCEYGFTDLWLQRSCNQVLQAEWMEECSLVCRQKIWSKRTDLWQCALPCLCIGCSTCIGLGYPPISWICRTSQESN
jgi:hypothetical protein